MTLYRRRAKFGMLSSPSQLTVTINGEGNALISTRPGTGYDLGKNPFSRIHVTRARLRHAIRNTDPLHTALRWRGNLSVRHPYSVPGPNSLWHIGK